VFENVHTGIHEWRVTGSDSDSGSFTTDVTQGVELSLVANVDASEGSETNTAEITGPEDNTVSASASGGFADSREDYDYQYYWSGSWTGTVDFGGVATLSRITGTATIQSGASIDVTAASDTDSATTSAGGSEYVEVAADDVYEVTVAVALAGGADVSTPSLDSLGFEARSPPLSLGVTDVRDTEIDVDWTGVPVADGYEVYYDTTSPVTDSSTLAGTPSSPPFTITGLSQGQQYYVNVRSEYTGE